jgi:hypothetical protein
MKKVLMALLPFVFSLCLLTGCFSPEDLLEKAKLQQDETETTTDFQGAVQGSNDLSSSGSYIQKK